MILPFNKMNIRKEILLLLLFIFSFTGFSQVTVIRKIDSESWFSMEIRTEVINKIFRAALASKLTVFKKEDLKEKMEAGEILDISVRKVMISINRTAEEPYPGHDTLVNVYKDRIEWLRDIVVCEKFCFVNKTDQYNVKYLSMGLSAFFDWGNKDIYWFKISDVQKLLGDFLFKSLLNAIETDTRFIYQEKENNSFSDRQVDLSKYLGIKLMNNFNNDILYYANIQLFPIYTNMNLNSFTSEKEYLAKCNVRTFDNSDFQTTYITEYQGDSLIQRIEEIEIESEFIPPFREDSFKAYKLSEKNIVS